MRPDRRIHIACALIEDGAGHILLVRKAGTQWFMQAGGKIESGESHLAALRRELQEEIGLWLNESEAEHLGRFSATAANEVNCLVDAEIFHIRTSHSPVLHAEIAEAVWVDQAAAEMLPLAPLTRDHVLPLWRTV